MNAPPNTISTDASSSSSDDERHPVEVLAEEFSERLRRGETPSIEAYAAQHPEHAELIRTIFPSLAVVERWSGAESETPPHRKQRNTIPEHSHFGDFQILRTLGMGGMGIVYEALQRSLQRRVALKVIQPLASEKANHRLRFRREAEAAASLHHTHIVPIFGIGEDHGLQYYAMQLIHGVTLQDVLQALRQQMLDSEASKAPLPDCKGNAGTTSEQRGEPPFDAHAAAMRLLRPSPHSPATGHRPLEHSGPGNLAWPTGLRTLAMDETPTLTKTPWPSSRGAQSSATDPSLPELRAAPASTQSYTSVDAGDFRLTPQRSASSTEVLESAEEPFDSQRAANRRLSGRAILPRQYYLNVCRWMANVASALEHAHQLGVLHRDIKPSNLMIDAEGIIWVTDFGLAKRANMDDATQAGEVLGTLRYMAPEQIVGGGDHRMDVYGLGLTLFELVTLRPAITSPKARLLDPQSHSEIAFTSPERRAIPKDLQTIILKACSYQPNDRYTTAGDLELDLRHFLDDLPIAARPIGPMESAVRWARRNPMIAMLAGCIATLFLAMSGMLIVWNRQQQHAIHRIGEEYQRAEFHWRKTTEALARAETERQRAELNMAMALEAFDTITSNIAARGHAFGDLSAFDEPIAPLDAAALSDASLSNADVDLLQAIEGFFLRFAQENEADLGLEHATARRRVGEIQHKLGRLDEAVASLEQALKDLTQLESRTESSNDPIDSNVLIADMATRQELIEVYQKRGQAPKALALFAGTRRWLDENASFRDSEEGQYAFAKLLGSMASTGSRFSSDRRRRPANGPTPFPLANRPNPGIAETLPPIQMARFQREMELCNQALELLQGLRASHPDVAMYRLTMSRTYRERARVHRQLLDIDAADRDLDMAIELLEQLMNEPSHSLLLKFELAETLGTPIAERDIDAHRAETALKLCDEVLAKDPQSPEALALRASLLTRLAWTMPMPMGPSRGEWALKALNQAIDIQRQLVDRYPNVPVYAMALLQTYVQRAETLAFLRRFDKALESLDEAESMSQQLATARIAPALIKSTVERLQERRRNLEARKEGKTVAK